MHAQDLSHSDLGLCTANRLEQKRNSIESVSVKIKCLYLRSK